MVVRIAYTQLLIGILVLDCWTTACEAFNNKWIQSRLNDVRLDRESILCGLVIRNVYLALEIF